MISIRGRRHRRIGAWILVISLLCIGTILSGCSDGGPEKGRTAAPDFTLRDISGREVSLSDFRGKVVLLDFWATWCPPCLMAIPHLNSLQEEYSADGFEILGINLDQTDARSLSRFTETMKISYAVLIGTPDVASKYGVNPIPTTFLIDRQGRLRSKAVGFSQALHEKTVSEIESLLKEK
jgi:cytochrome c biogenesis protein CcmG/thiol:disulfide interchange protein DsbE